ncbi:MAG: hypothetical protein WCQ41_10090 [Bacillota bacterium]
MLTLGQAAIETGMAKSAISRAIKSGRLSARKKENGSFEIDPAELFRVYPPASSSNGYEQRQEERSATPNETNGLQREVVVLRELIEEIKGERDNLREERERLLKVIEEQAGTVKQLTHQPERPSAEDQGTWKHVWVVLAILTTCTAVLVLVWWQGR